MNCLLNQGLHTPVTADSAKEILVQRTVLDCPIWMKASSFLGTYSKHTLTKVMSMAENSINIFAQLAAPLFH